MKTRTLIVLLIPLVLLAGFLVDLSGNNSSQSFRSGTAIDPQVALVVSQFGKQMQYVSLQAPALNIQSAIDEHYAPYVTPELLSVWKSRPRTVPGRYTSSPWPERIEVLGIDPQRDGSYIVHGTVMEVTSSELEHGGVANSYPVTLRLARHNKNWLIMQFQQ